MNVLAAGPQVDTDGTWTLGVKIGLPFVVIVVLLLVIATLFSSYLMLRWRADNDPDWGLPACFAGGFFVVLLLFVGGMAWGYYPWSSEYHQYRTVTGTVDKISNRLVVSTDSDGNTSGGQKFVVVFKGSDQQYGINDTRASLTKPGDVISINCIRSFEYGSTDGYDCKWGGKK